MKATLLNRADGSLEEITLDALLERVREPCGIVLVLSAFVRRLRDVEKAIRQSCPQRQKAPVTLFLRRYRDDAGEELAAKLYDPATCGDETVVALVDQPWHTLRGAWAKSATLTELVESVQSSGGRFTCAYVTDDDSDGADESEGLARYRRWAGDCPDLGRMGQAERRLFFGLAKNGAVRTNAETARWKDRLEAARASYCDAVLRTVSALFAHAERADDRALWRLMTLALAADYLHGALSLRDTVAKTLQPRRPGWGLDTALPEGTERGGLQSIDMTARVLGLLALRADLPPPLLQAIQALAPTRCAFSILAGWRPTPLTRPLQLKQRIASIERTLRETRNAIVHHEGSSPSPLFLSSIEQVVLTLHELAEGAREAMPSGSGAFELGTASWMTPLADLKPANAQRYAAQAAELFGQRPRGLFGLIGVLSRFEERHVRTLTGNTGWSEWHHLYALRSEAGRLLRDD